MHYSAASYNIRISFCVLAANLIQLGNCEMEGLVENTDSFMVCLICAQISKSYLLGFHNKIM